MPAPLLVPLGSSQMGVPTLKKPRLSACYESARSIFLYKTAHLFQHKPSASIERLPDELLSEILSFAIAESIDRLDATLLPVTLSHVSSRWRRVALSTSSLWTRITLTYPLSREQLARSAHYLLRSRKQPLDILLDLRDPDWDWDLQESEHGLHWKDVDSILRLLLTHVNRWKRFELLSDVWMPIFAFLCYARNVESAPLLEGVHLFRCNACFADADVVFSPRSMRMPMPFFGHAKLEKLSDLSLVGVHVDWSSPSLQNLRRLEMKYLASDVAPTMDEFASLLRASPDLQYISIAGRGPKFEQSLGKSALASSKIEPPLPPKVNLPNLSDLRIGFIDSEHAVQLVETIKTDGLRNLAIQGMFFDLGVPLAQPVDATSLLTSLAGEGTTIPLSKIASVTLEDIHAPLETISTFYEALHDMKCLTLRRTTNYSLTALDPQVTSSTIPCKKLVELDCHHQDPLLLEEIIEARLNNLIPHPPASPFAVSLTTAEDLHPDVSARLRELGVRILQDGSNILDADLNYES